VAEFRGLMQQGHPRFETLRSAPCSTGVPACVSGGWAMAISISDNCATAEVSLIVFNRERTKIGFEVRRSKPAWSRE
jgi:hypothetical protein